jgi:chemotaxis methyl-accepting protein methylase
VDIVPGNIEKAKAAWPTKQPHVFQFYCADVVDGFEFVDKLVLQAQQEYPTNTHDWSQGWDLIFSREFLQHLPHEAVKRVLRNFNKTGSKYLLLTHNPSNAINKDIQFGAYCCYMQST